MLFRKPPAERPDLVLAGPRVMLRPPRREDYRQWATLRRDSEAFLQPWEPLWPADDLTARAFRRRIDRYESDIQKDETYPFFLFDLSGATLLGGLTLTNIRRGAASMASLGYWMGEIHAGKGFMSEAVRLLLPMAAWQLRLRRIEAACVPENRASLRLLEKAEFVREGYAFEYLSINGVWRDHVLFARLIGSDENRRA
ncbi:MAG: GNAT family N-acetyltransferase [Methylocystis sp.]|jgi:ribosomal-protein-alanine N-acetyltransferase|nr:GNAT family N-acetyltransferase [Methylocystis sp.]MCA3584331.1 GNAT family N-acetyltransferase [Methylocystis sp.]MCA3589346.1 GNAT family N-acetyltransferase [Methylocystis sp.]MCA3592822.1 GNAT family N-acetyltransferase [Methylocystis sp.]